MLLIFADTAPNPAVSEEPACSAEVETLVADVDITNWICKLIETPKPRDIGSLDHDSTAAKPLEPLTDSVANE